MSTLHLALSSNGDELSLWEKISNKRPTPRAQDDRLSDEMICARKTNKTLRRTSFSPKVKSYWQWESVKLRPRSACIKEVTNSWEIDSQRLGLNKRNPSTPFVWHTFQPFHSTFAQLSIISVLIRITAIGTHKSAQDRPRKGRIRWPTTRLKIRMRDTLTSTSLNEGICHSLPKPAPRAMPRYSTSLLQKHSSADVVPIYIWAGWQPFASFSQRVTSSGFFFLNILKPGLM